MAASTPYEVIVSLVLIIFAFSDYSKTFVLYVTVSVTSAHFAVFIQPHIDSSQEQAIQASERAAGDARIRSEIVERLRRVEEEKEEQQVELVHDCEHYRQECQRLVHKLAEANAEKQRLQQRLTATRAFHDRYPVISVIQHEQEMRAERQRGKTQATKWRLRAISTQAHAGQLKVRRMSSRFLIRRLTRPRLVKHQRTRVHNLSGCTSAATEGSLNQIGEHDQMVRSIQGTQAQPVSEAKAIKEPGAEGRMSIVRTTGSSTTTESAQRGDVAARTSHNAVADSRLPQQALRGLAEQSSASKSVQTDADLATDTINGDSHNVASKHMLHDVRTALASPCVLGASITNQTTTFEKHRELHYDNIIASMNTSPECRVLLQAAAKGIRGEHYDEVQSKEVKNTVESIFGNWIDSKLAKSTARMIDANTYPAFEKFKSSKSPREALKNAAARDEIQQTEHMQKHDSGDVKLASSVPVPDVSSPLMQESARPTVQDAADIDRVSEHEVEKKQASATWVDTPQPENLLSTGSEQATARPHSLVAADDDTQPVIPSSEQLRISVITKSSPSQNQHLENEFLKVFSEGYRLVKTSPRKSPCGLDSLDKSWGAQYNQLVQLYQISELQNILQAAGVTSVDNFAEDELFRVMHQWGLQQGYVICLGICANGEPERLFHPDIEVENYYVVWISNDLNGCIGDLDGQPMNGHWSAMAPKKAVNVADEPRPFQVGADNTNADKDTINRYLPTHDSEPEAVDGIAQPAPNSDTQPAPLLSAPSTDESALQFLATELNTQLENQSDEAMPDVQDQGNGFMDDFERDDIFASAHPQVNDTNPNMNRFGAQPDFMPVHNNLINEANDVEMDDVNVGAAQTYTASYIEGPTTTASQAPPFPSLPPNPDFGLNQQNVQTLPDEQLNTIAESMTDDQWQALLDSTVYHNDAGSGGNFCDDGYARVPDADLSLQNDTNYPLSGDSMGFTSGASGYVPPEEAQNFARDGQGKSASYEADDDCPFEPDLENPAPWLEDNHMGSASFFSANHDPFPASEQAPVSPTGLHDFDHTASPNDHLNVSMPHLTPEQEQFMDRLIAASIEEEEEEPTRAHLPEDVSVRLYQKIDAQSHQEFYEHFLRNERNRVNPNQAQAYQRSRLMMEEAEKALEHWKEVVINLRKERKRKKDKELKEHPQYKAIKQSYDGIDRAELRAELVTAAENRFLAAQMQAGLEPETQQELASRPWTRRGDLPIPTSPLPPPPRPATELEPWAQSLLPVQDAGTISRTTVPRNSRPARPGQQKHQKRSGRKS